MKKRYQESGVEPSESLGVLLLLEIEIPIDLIAPLCVYCDETETWLQHNRVITLSCESGDRGRWKVFRPLLLEERSGKEKRDEI